MEQSKTFKQIFDEAKLKPAYWDEGIRIEFAELVWREMEKKNMQTKKGEFSKSIGISQVKLTLILKGKCDMKISEICDIALKCGFKIGIVEIK